MEMMVPVKLSPRSRLFHGRACSPLTPSGNITVDGITASTYVTVFKNCDRDGAIQYTLPLSKDQIIHMYFSPFRFLCIGLSSAHGKYFDEEMKEVRSLKVCF